MHTLRSFQMNYFEKMIFLLLVTFGKFNQIDAVNHQPPSLFRNTSEVQHGSIKYAGLVLRHGDRAPVRFYPTDPYQNYSWPVGCGQLTNLGKQQIYEVGKFFQPYYRNLTSNQYEPEKVIMQASSTNRHLMSAELFLAGYFPPIGSQIWNKNLLWQPISVFTVPLEQDNVIGMRKACPRRDQAINHFYATNPTIREVCANYTEMFHYIQNNTGWNFSDCTSYSTFLNLIQVHDILKEETINNLTLPKWTETVFPEPLTRLKGLVTDIEADDLTVARLRSGPLFSIIAADMFNIAGLDRKFPKYVFSETAPLHVFSGEGMTIVTMLRPLKLYSNIEPSYGAILGFELHLEGEQYLVKAVYEESVHQPLQILEIPGCSGNCTLENFMDLIEPLIPINWDLECKTDAATNSISTSWSFYLFIFIVIFIIIIIVFVFILNSSTRCSSYTTL